ncbi:MAG TPA: hypothetical protein ENI34_04625 [candidate division WOR-3 bacterium]|uniref:Mut7-C RNAse domain-containing protein n=1 Tax=candidate division WOR-3 bacterium TaxID=2052148 RepID=A0A9C9EMJ7_UNCW3|nr:hypothetical protein [candidate division WOR-3 bacterium]
MDDYGKRFICDGMLGKLCKLMRMCGIDTAYSNRGRSIIIEAKRDNRIVLTKNTLLKNKNGVHFLESTDPAVQLKNILIYYSLRNEIKLFSRCIECNCRLQVVDKETVKDKIPYFTYKNFKEFAQCPQCRKVYWKGSHYKNMKKKVDEIIGGL